MDAAKVKPWIEEHIRSINEADAGPLAQYVFALLRNHIASPEAYKQCVSRLKEFLGDATEGFVASLFAYLKSVGVQIVDESVPPPPGSKGAEAAHPPTSQNAESLTAVRSATLRPGQSQSQLQQQRAPRPQDGQGAGVKRSAEEISGTEQRSRTSSPSSGSQHQRGSRGAHQHQQQQQHRDQQSGRPSGQQGRGDGRTLSVQNLPAELNQLDTIATYFKQFGAVTNVSLDLEGGKATVQYATPEEATAAWKSRQAVLGDRFIKIFWAGNRRPQQAERGDGGHGQRHPSFLQQGHAEQHHQQAGEATQPYYAEGGARHFQQHNFPHRGGYYGSYSQPEFVGQPPPMKRSRVFNVDARPFHSEQAQPAPKTESLAEMKAAIDEKKQVCQTLQQEIQRIKSSLDQLSQQQQESEGAGGSRTVVQDEEIRTLRASLLQKTEQFKTEMLAFSETVNRYQTAAQQAAQEQQNAAAAESAEPSSATVSSSQEPGTEAQDVDQTAVGDTAGANPTQPAPVYRGGYAPRGRYFPPGPQGPVPFRGRGGFYGYPPRGGTMWAPAPRGRGAMPFTSKSWSAAGGSSAAQPTFKLDLRPKALMLTDLPEERRSEESLRQLFREQPPANVYVEESYAVVEFPSRQVAEKAAAVAEGAQIPFEWHRQEAAQQPAEDDQDPASASASTAHVADSIGGQESSGLEPTDVVTQ